MPALRFTALALSLIAAFVHSPAAADATPSPLQLGAPNISNLYGLELNQWYVFANRVTAGTIIDGQLTEQSDSKVVPTGADLSLRVEDSHAAGSKLASAMARVSPTSIGASASARDPLNPLGAGTAAVSYSTVTYFALLDQDASFKFDLKLDGQLHRLGDAMAPDISGAAVAALAYGSHANYTGEKSSAAFLAAGLDLDSGSETLIQQLSRLKSSTQTHLDVFGAQTTPVNTWVDVDTTLHVTAQGTQQNCEKPISPACGRYFYFFSVLLFNGAQNGGLADFSHTLEVTSVSVDGAAAQPFGAISAVPEPATAPMLALGVAGLLGVAARRRLRL
ncbi:PEP-CTERM sorting domain-containing protein [Roseateles sp. P5_E7]